MPCAAKAWLAVAADALIAAEDVALGVKTPYGRFCSEKSLSAGMLIVPSHGMPARAQAGRREAGLMVSRQLERRSGGSCKRSAVHGDELRES